MVKRARKSTDERHKAFLEGAFLNHYIAYPLYEFVSAYPGIRRFLQSLRNRREKIEKLINIKLDIRKYSVMNILNIEYFYNLIVRIVFLTEPTTN